MSKILLLICACFTCLTACSRLDIAFRWADTFIASKVDDYFDISSSQKKSLKVSLHKDFEKIKSKVLPEWIDNAKQLEQDISEGTLDEEKVGSIFSLVMNNVEQFTSYFTESAVDFISMTNPQQLSYFAKTLYNKNQEDLKKLQDTKKYQQEYREKYYKYFEMFLGSLTDSQKSLVEKHIQQSPFPMELKIKNKEWVYQKFAKESTSSEKMKTFVRDFYAHPEKYNEPQYQLAFKNYQESLQKLVTHILMDLTPKQKKNLLENLQDKVTQLERIRGRS